MTCVNGRANFRGLWSRGPAKIMFELKCCAGCDIYIEVKSISIEKIVKMHQIVTRVNMMWSEALPSHAPTPKFASIVFDDTVLTICLWATKPCKYSDTSLFAYWRCSIPWTRQWSLKNVTKIFSTTLQILPFSLQQRTKAWIFMFSLHIIHFATGKIRMVSNHVWINRQEFKEHSWQPETVLTLIEYSVCLHWSRMFALCLHKNGMTSGDLSENCQFFTIILKNSNKNLNTQLN